MILYWPTSSNATYIPSFNLSYLIVGSLRQTQFSSSQFCHGVHILISPIAFLYRWTRSSTSALIFFCFSHVAPYPVSVFRRILGLDSSRVQPTSVSLLFSLSLMLSYLTWSISLGPHAHLHKRHLCPFPFLHVEAVSSALSPTRLACWLNNYLVQPTLDILFITIYGTTLQ